MGLLPEVPGGREAFGLRGLQPRFLVRTGRVEDPQDLARTKAPLKSTQSRRFAISMASVQFENSPGKSQDCGTLWFVGPVSSHIMAR
ncbi:MAG: hypothetical protein WDN00_00040 [Limisphaerales bacterium]